ncbi:hydroxyquinol 1,2-dioxygenase, partial [Candidatus Bathyarchaeota archaeon]|nr:hydroxyquinol 1,2-dioxygenase [Candidatus Bathyarchaeota archaeon]
MSDTKRNETQLICDILGLESLVDEITSSNSPTPTAILGPFHRPSAPLFALGSSIVASSPEYAPHLTHFSGRVLSPSGLPVTGAMLDIWHTAPNGMYEQQDAAQPEYNLRGRFTTDSDGRFSLICLRPVAYPIPADGPGGELLRMLDRSPWRPAHIHVI